ncbi:MAG: phytanoyl-CoA dioxygenase family protein [Salinisphaera sp.]|jgi:phytanoyl-CoA hydroxylase|nr:phytanoyl-CoA dioxygenase family protein [Salinisphaera sp.]
MNRLEDAIGATLQPGLTPAQLAVFAEDGFLIMRQLASVERIAAMRSMVLDHIEKRLEPIEYEADVAYPGAPASRQAEGGDTARRLLQAYDRDPLLAEWAADKRLTAIAAQLLDSFDVWLTLNHHNCVMTKQPYFSTATAWHRDLRYWSFQTPRLVNAWLALGDENTANGCMHLLPGSQHAMLSEDALDDAQFLLPNHPDNKPLIDSAVDAKLAPGDVLFFDAGTFHAAGANTTDERKLSVVTSYFGADNAPIAGTRSARRPAVHVRKAPSDA